jgi:hypothetical protein
MKPPGECTRLTYVWYDQSPLTGVESLMEKDGTEPCIVSIHRAMIWPMNLDRIP